MTKVTRMYGSPDRCSAIDCDKGPTRAAGRATSMNSYYSTNSLVYVCADHEKMARLFTGNWEYIPPAPSDALAEWRQRHIG